MPARSYRLLVGIQSRRGASVSSNFEYKDSYGYGVAVVLTLISVAIVRLGSE